MFISSVVKICLVFGVLNIQVIASLQPLTGTISEEEKGDTIELSVSM